jgi:hypothetical protein
VTYLIAWAFVVALPFMVGAARFCRGLARDDPGSRTAKALARVMVGATAVAAFLAAVSALYIAGLVDLVRILQPGILPAFLALELLLIVLPAYLRWLRART